MYLVFCPLVAEIEDCNCGFERASPVFFFSAYF